MKVKSTTHYEVLFGDDELVDALVHWISNVRSRQDMIDVSKIIHNAEVKVIRRNKKTLLRFTFDEPDKDF